MDADTDLGGPAVAFPLTHGSLVRDLASADAGARGLAWDALVAAYWKPVYKYLRLRWGAANEDAKDLTQAFFAQALEKAFFAAFDPARARFRTFVRVCLDRFAANERRAATRLKRGGAGGLLSLDFAGAEGELGRQIADPGADPDTLFRREWLRGLFALAVDDLRARCAAEARPVHFALFERYDLDGPDRPNAPTYAQLAAAFELPLTQVTNYLAWARRQFRACLLDRLRTATGGEAEYQEEVRALFGGGGG
jgi:DNA-directed RNA polymerase specialized sigma24 family protein